jgi:Fe-S protein assembly co-chaperone HscB
MFKVQPKIKTSAKPTKNLKSTSKSPKRTIATHNNSRTPKSHQILTNQQQTKSAPTNFTTTAPSTSTSPQLSNTRSIHQNSVINHNFSPTRTYYTNNQFQVNLATLTITRRLHQTCQNHSTPTPNDNSHGDTNTNTTKVNMNHQNNQINQQNIDANLMDPNCWNCPNPSLSKRDMFCTSCKIIQPITNPLSNQNYFELYNIPTIQYNIDLNRLEKRFHQLQQSLHPDLFSTKTLNEQEISSNYSIYVNRSYDILKDDFLRAKYILSLQAPELIINDESLTDYEHLPPLNNHLISQVVHPQHEEQNQQEQHSVSQGDSVKIVKKMSDFPPYKSELPKSELLSVLEYHEIIEDSNDQDELLNVYQSIQQRLQEVKGDIGKFLDVEKNYQKALEQIEIFHYNRNLLKALVPKLPSELLQNQQ